MQAYLPIIQDLLTQWYQFTLDNAVYAAALAASVWLLTALFYRIRIGLINRKNRARAKEAQDNIDAAQLQAQKLQEELTANTTRMEESEIAANKATQRALDLERRITERNVQLTDSLQALTVSFNLDRQALAAGDDPDGEGLWRQYSAALAQLTERLRTELQTKADLQQACQAETAKLAEKETLLEALQSRLNAQSQQLAQLEEHNAQLQRQVADNAQKQQADLARLAELEQLASEWTQTKTQQFQLEETIHAQNIRIEQLQQAGQIQAAVIEQPPQAPAEPEKVVTEKLAVSTAMEQPPQIPVEHRINDVSDKIKHIFGARQQATEQEAKPANAAPVIDKPAEEIRPAPAENGMESIQAQPASPESQPLENKAPKLAGKIKQMFGSARQQIAKFDEKMAGETSTADKTAETSRSAVMEAGNSDIQPEPSDTEQQPSAAVSKQSDNVTGKIRNLFGTRKSPRAAIQAAPAEQDEPALLPMQETAQPLADHNLDGVAGTGKKIPTRLKSLLRKFQPNA
jgi:DNA repair exonuclease SbcCD ATPase subunit